MPPTRWPSRFATSILRPPCAAKPQRVKLIMAGGASPARDPGMFRRFALIAVAVCALSTVALSQADDPPQAVSPTSPKVSFELNWPASDPQWFQITVDSTGAASYESQPHTQPNETP